MAFHPEVFVSAAPVELAPYRELVKESLRSMGITPVEHTDFHVAYGPLDGLLKLEIGRCDAVIHLAGMSFGPEPSDRTVGAVRRSYAHYEFDVAQALNKQMFCFVTEHGTETVRFPKEDEEAQALQGEHRRTVVGLPEVWHFGGAESLVQQLRQLRTRLLVRRRLVSLPFARKCQALVGRDRMMAELCEQIAAFPVTVLHPPEKFAAVSVSAGKTALAVECGWHLYDSGQYDFVLFVPAGSRMEIESTLAAFARMDALALVQEEIAGHAVRLSAVRHWLRCADHAGRVLVILDSVDHEVTWWAVKAMLPWFEGAKVLITSRLINLWPDAGHIEVGAIAMDASVEMLVAPRGQKTTVSTRERDSLEHLARMLSWQPLALTLAGHLMAHGGTNATQLVDLLSKEGVPDVSSAGVQAARWQPLFVRMVREAVHRLDATARAFLHVLVCLAPEPAAIPFAIFAGRPDASQTRTTLNNLAAIGLIALVDDGQSVLIHRLVREAVRERMSVNQMAESLDAARALIEASLPRSEQSSGGAGMRERMVPHCRVLLGQLNGHPLEAHAAHLAQGLATFLRDCRRLAEAEHFQRRAVHIVDRNFGKDHSELAPELRRLAKILREMHRQKEAEELHRRAIEILRNQKPPAERELVAELYALAGCLRSAGRFANAKAALEEALAIEEKQSGRMHPRTGIAVHALATMLEVMRRPKEALPLYKRALEIDEHATVPSPARIAVRLHNLATTLERLGDKRAAMEYQQRALELDVATFGKSHPELVVPLAQYAGLVEQAQGPAAAEPCWRRAVQCAESSLDAGDPEIAATLVGLASVCRETGRGDEAATLAQRALDSVKSSDMPWHPLTRSVRELCEQLLSGVLPENSPN